MSAAVAVGRSSRCMKAGDTLTVSARVAAAVTTTAGFFSLSTEMKTMSRPQINAVSSSL